jgi:hypothetical protein
MSVGRMAKVVGAGLIGVEVLTGCASGVTERKPGTTPNPDQATEEAIRSYAATCNQAWLNQPNKLPAGCVSANGRLWFLDEFVERTY